MSRVLNSWKEIAAYVGRGVRTVQRWECELHFPVRRPHGRVRSAVIALSDDIDYWMAQSPTRERLSPGMADHPRPLPPWKDQLGLPVGGKDETPRISDASPEELESWLAAYCSQPPNGGSDAHFIGTETPPVRASIQTSRQLRSANRRLRGEVQQSLQAVFQECQALALRLIGPRKPQ